MLDKWDQRFMDLANFVAAWSKDPSTQVGAVIANPLDPSVLLMPSLAWNAAENANASVGFMLGLGDRPELAGFLPIPKSEFGTLPNIAFVSGSFFF